MPSELERFAIQDLRTWGCKCKEPLLGWRPEWGPRCRLCNTENPNRAWKAEAVEVLRPFNAIAQAVFYVDEDGREINASRADDLAVWGFDRVELTYGHLRAARRLVEKEDGRAS